MHKEPQLTGRMSKKISIKLKPVPQYAKLLLGLIFVTSLPSDTPKELTPTAQAALYLSPFDKSSGARKKWVRIDIG